jgi:hypothetical protein
MPGAAPAYERLACFDAKGKLHWHGGLSDWCEVCAPTPCRGCGHPEHPLRPCSFVSLSFYRNGGKGTEGCLCEVEEG